MTFAVGNGKPIAQMKHTTPRPLKQLTAAEQQLMNVLWDSHQALSVHEIVERYPEPKPAYTTVATFLKILEAKGYVEHRRKAAVGRTFMFSPMLTREKYISLVVGGVKDSIFGSSAGKMFSFLVQNEEISDDELRELLALINSQLPACVPVSSAEDGDLAPRIP